MENNVEKFLEEARENPVLQENNIGIYPREEINNLEETVGFYKKATIFFCIFSFIFGLGLLYFIALGKLQTTINQPIDVETKLNTTIQNQYAFTPNTNNQYSINLNATIMIPNTMVIRMVNAT